MHAIAPSLTHILFARVKSTIGVIPPPKIVSTTSAATSITIAVTIITSVVEIPFIINLWFSTFKKMRFSFGMLGKG